MDFSKVGTACYGSKGGTESVGGGGRFGEEMDVAEV